MNPKTWAEVDTRTLFTEADCTGALLLLKNYELIIYGWYENIVPLEVIIDEACDII